MPTPRFDRFMSRRAALAALLGGGAAALTGCASDGHLSIFGYNTVPNYDCDIRTVYVPLFKTKIFETTPYREMEITLTRAVVDAIELKTPFKVVSDPDRADTELQGTLVVFRKLLQNRTPFNEVREIELTLGAEIVWHDLRPGHEGRILTNPRRREDLIGQIDGPFDPTVPGPARGPDKPLPVLISDTGRGIPELGETSTTALQMAINRVATRIVSAMEKPW